MAEVIAQSEKELQTLQLACEAYNAHYIGHAYIDTNRQWDWPERVDECYHSLKDNG